MTCVVCSREARGFGIFNPALQRTDPRRFLERWVFCSMRCMEAFSKVMERLTGLREDAVLDPTDLEIAAMHAALAPLGDYVASIGMDRPLGDYGKAEVLRLVEVVIDAYQAHMLLEHERLAEQERSFLEQRLAAPPLPASGANSRIPF